MVFWTLVIVIIKPSERSGEEEKKNKKYTIMKMVGNVVWRF